MQEKETFKTGKIGIIGDGRFAEAVAYLESKVHKDIENLEIVIWTYKEEHARRAQEKGTFRHSKEREKGEYFQKEKRLPSSVRITHNAREVIEGSDTLFSMIPAQKTRPVIEQYFKQLIRENWEKIQIIISGTKGIEEDTDKIMSKVWEDIFFDEAIDVSEKYAVLGGLTFASDMVNNVPMVATIAAKRKETQKRGYDLLNDEKSFYVIPSNDVDGVEIVGAAKNVIAIAAGAANELYGDSAAQAVISAGIVEVKKLAMALGSEESTFYSWSPSMGDLEGTAKSKKSRNFQEGVANAKGKKREKTGIAEGVPTVKAIVRMAEQMNIKMPVCNAVFKIVERQQPIAQIVDELLIEIGQYTEKVARASWINNKNDNPNNTSSLIK